MTAQIVAAGSLAVLAPLFAEAVARRDDERVAALVRHGLVVASMLSVVAVVLVSGAGTALRVAGAALNVVLDALLIRVWGPAGVGVATAIANAAICFALLVAVARLRASVASSVLGGPRDYGVLRDLVRLGAPAALMIAGEVVVFQLAGLVVEGHGTAALAAHQLALTMVTATFVIPLGIAQATAVRVARLGVTDGVGAQRRAGMVGLADAAIVACACALFLLCAPEGLSRLFVDDDATAGAARAVLRLAAAFLLFDGAQVVASGALRGILDTRVPTILAVGAYGVLTPLAGGLAAPSGYGSPACGSGSRSGSRR